jgi:ubiquinone biosynthesis protein
MRGPHNIWRLIRTGATMERSGALGLVLDAMDAPRPLRIAARVLAFPFRWLGYRGDTSMPPVTRALTALGPAYIKFGQILSTRPDVVGSDLAVQLRILQDKLPPFERAVAMASFEAETGIKVDDAFDDFSEAVAAASIAQVHKAKLKATGEDVAIKVLRPGVEKAFQKDIDAFYFVAKFVEFFSPSSRRLRPTDVVSHFEGVVHGELDLRMESSAASEFAANTINDKGFGVPAVKWSLSAKRVMTMSWVEGEPLGDNAALDAAGHDRKVLGERVLQLFLQHALRDGLFHGDMHQGNLKVSASGDILAYDFGIMGYIDEYTRRVYAEILFGFIQRDYRRVAEVHFEAGYVPANQDVEEFARALRSVGEPIFGMDATRISMARLLSHLFEVTERFGMETRTELILLQRTMVVVEGVARSLDERINIWDVAGPVVEDYIKTSIGPVAVLRDLGKAARVLSRFGPHLPELIEGLLVRTTNQEQTAPKTPKRTKIKWITVGAVVGAVIVATATYTL